MGYLTENKDAKQLPGEPPRRWFASEDMDLIVWYGADGQPFSFQLCYGKPVFERALTWDRARGFHHAAVDTGEWGGSDPKATPILVPDGTPDLPDLLERFRGASAQMPADLATFVEGKLLTHPGGAR